MRNSYSHKEAPWGMIDSHENMHDGHTFMQGEKKKKVIPVQRIIHVSPLSPVLECYIHETASVLHSRFKETYFFKSVHTYWHDYSHTEVCPSCISRHWSNSATLLRLFSGSPSCVFGREAAKGCFFCLTFLQLEEECVFSPSSHSGLYYSFCRMEVRLGGLRKRTCFVGMEHFYLWLFGKLPFSFGTRHGTRNMLERHHWHLWSTDGCIETGDILRYHQ